MTSPGLNSRDTETSRRQRGKPTTFTHPISSKPRLVLNPRRNSKLIGIRDLYQAFDSIFEVPRSLRQLQRNAFVPHIVSIGPYHKKQEHLQEMETYKKRLLGHVVQRTKEFSQLSLRNEMSRLETETRKCYAQPIKDLNSNQFVKMMLLDACFIIELLYNSAIGWEESEYKDPWGVIVPRGFLPFIQRDLLMLENQLPLRVLDRMFELTWGDRSTQGQSVAKLALKFFDSVVPAEISKNPKNEPQGPAQLDLNPAAGISKNPQNEPPDPGQLDLNPAAGISENPQNEPPDPGQLDLNPAAGISENPQNEPPDPGQLDLNPAAGISENPQNEPPGPGQLDLNPAAGISENPSKKPRGQLHLLDIVRHFLEPTVHQANGEEDKRGLKPVQANCEGKEKYSADESIAMHSVTRLRSMGIKFEEKKGGTKFTDIEFKPKEGKLLIPQLRIRDSTQSIFLNLMAFELCYPHPSSYITSYITFMDGLINSPKDVEHLQEKNIIVHDLGSEEDVASLFNNLRKEIAFNPKDYYLSQVSKDLNRYKNQRLPRWSSTLRHEYLKDPWKIISLGVAGLLILLTVAQTVYAIVSYHRPSLLLNHSSVFRFRSMNGIIYDGFY